MKKYNVFVLLTISYLAVSISLTFFSRGDRKYAVESAIGYPAPESTLATNRFYWCNASIVEIHPTRTNYLVVLQEMTPSTNDMWRAVGTNRLFELPRALNRGAIYSVTKTDGGETIYRAISEVPH